MKKEIVLNKNLSLGINTKTKTNIKSLIHLPQQPSIPHPEPAIREGTPFRKNVECQRQTLQIAWLWEFFNQTNLKEVA